MYTIQEVDFEIYFGNWQKWESFLPDDPAPRKLAISTTYIASSVFKYAPTKTIGFFGTGSLIGGGCIYHKQTDGLSIGGIGKMAVDPLFRRNGIASHLIDVSLIYMFKHGFNISVLWASVLELYENFGYIPLTRDHKETNMMYRPILGLPTGWSKQRLLDLPAQVGTW